MSDSRRSFITQKTAPWIFLAPTLILFAMFMIYPIIQSFLLSFQSSDPLNPGFVGLDNYKTLVKDPIFWIALKNNFIYLLFQVPIMVFIALVLTVLIAQPFVRAKGFLRMSLFLPAITALVASAMIIKLLFNSEYGIINYVLNQFNIESIQWLNHRIYSKIVIIIAVTWRWTGYNMVILMAGYAGIPETLYESADIDGANAFQRFFKITIPLLKPVILFVVITSTIGTLQLFDESLILTNGGPDNATITIGHYLYNVGFRYFKFEYAAALSYVMVLIIGALSLIEMKASGKEDA